MEALCIYAYIRQSNVELNGPSDDLSCAIKTESDSLLLYREILNMMALLNSTLDFLGSRQKRVY